MQIGKLKSSRTEMMHRQIAWSKEINQINRVFPRLRRFGPWCANQCFRLAFGWTLFFNRVPGSRRWSWDC